MSNEILVIVMGAIVGTGIIAAIGCCVWDKIRGRVVNHDYNPVGNEMNNL